MTSEAVRNKKKYCQNCSLEILEILLCNSQFQQRTGLVYQILLH